jgi:hypothetical protein
LGAAGDFGIESATDDLMAEFEDPGVVVEGIVFYEK